MACIESPKTFLPRFQGVQNAKLSEEPQHLWVSIRLLDLIWVFAFTGTLTRFLLNLLLYLHVARFTRLSKGPYASGYVHAEFGRDISEERLEWM